MGGMEELRVLFLGQDPSDSDPGTQVVRRGLLYDRQQSDPRWWGEVAAVFGGQFWVEWLAQMDACLAGMASAHRKAKIDERVTGRDLGSVALYREIQERGWVTPRLSSKIRTTALGRGPVARLANNLPVRTDNLWGRRIADNISHSQKLRADWSTLDRETRHQDIQTAHTIGSALMGEPERSRREQLYLAAHSMNPEKVEVYLQLREKMMANLTLRHINWDTFVNRELWVEGESIQGMPKFVESVAQLASIQNKERNAALRQIDPRGAKLAYDLPRLHRSLDTVGVTGVEEIFNPKIYNDIAKMLGLEDYFDQYVTVRSSDTLAAAAYIDPPTVVEIVTDRRTGLLALMDMIHEGGHAMEMVGRNLFLPPSLRAATFGFVGTEIAAILFQIAGYNELGDGKLAEYGIAFGDGRRRALERLMECLSRHLSSADFERQFYSDRFVGGVDAMIELDAQALGRYGLVQYHPTERANNLRSIYYAGYGINYVLATIAAMQMYHYVEREFGGLFNPDAGDWFNQRYAVWADAIPWTEKVEQAIGEKVDPSYLVRELATVDWHDYYQGKVRALMLAST